MDAAVIVVMLVVLAILGLLIASFVKIRRKKREGMPPKTASDRIWGIVIAIIALALVMLASYPRMHRKQQLIQDITNSPETSQQAR